MDKFENRKFLIFAIIMLVGVIFLGRLFYIQILDKTYERSANNQALTHQTLYPSRGVIYDRNGEILVFNEAAFDLMVIPRQVDKDMDTALFCRLLKMDTADFVTRLTEARKYSSYRASVFEKQISARDWLIISERLYDFPGFYGQKKNLTEVPSPGGGTCVGLCGRN